MKDLFQSIEASGLIVLECGECGERLLLLGREEDWPKEHRDAFACSRCGNRITLAHRVDGTANAIRSLLQSSIRPLSQGPSSDGSLPFSPH
jgi:DNA-directed RNA polymerase subunit RPC12/RpoP